MTDYVTAFLERERRRVAHELELVRADCAEAATRLEGTRKARASYSEQLSQIERELEQRRDAAMAFGGPMEPADRRAVTE